MKMNFGTLKLGNTALALFAAAVGFGILEQSVSAVAIPGLGGTGAAAFTLPVQPPGGAASLSIASPRPSSWLNDIPGAQWIAPGTGLDRDLTGYYEYELQFNLAGFDLSTVQLSGEWRSDNDGVVKLNGVDTAFTSGFASFSDPAPSTFSLNSGFVAGVNSLRFKVWNGQHSDPEGSPALQSGLLAFVRGEGRLLIDPTPTVPDAGTSAILLGAGVLLLAATRRLTSVE